MKTVDVEKFQTVVYQVQSRLDLTTFEHNALIASRLLAGNSRATKKTEKFSLLSY